MAALSLHASISCVPWGLNEHTLVRRTAAVRPSGATDAFGCDGLGNWTTYTNAEGRVYRMAYDALGRLVAATNAANEQVFANRYDSVGNLTNRSDGAGNTTRYTYDVLDRLVTRDSFNHETHEKHESYAYDAVGNLLTASNAVAQNAFAYDIMDRLSSASTTLTNATFAATYVLRTKLKRYAIPKLNVFDRV